MNDHPASGSSASSDSTPWDGSAYSVKRHGVTITNCDSEPVQTPGCVQAHGALLVLRSSDLTILQASENSAERLGHPPEKLLGQAIGLVAGAEGEARLRELLNREPVERNPLHAFTLPAPDAKGGLDVSVHAVDGAVVMEFEETGRETGAPPPDYYSLMKKSVARLQSARSVRDYCQKITEEVRSLTGLDRVMAYRFHEDANGEVFAESKRADLPAWLGLHYPADDIPKPAREIFKRIWIRPLPDARGALAELVPLVNPETGKPLDMTHCALRGASVMYTEYLQNMGVAASLTMPILRDGELWGLIACHHYVPARFPYEVRAACEFLAQVVSLQLRAVEEREHLVYRLALEGAHSQLIARAAQESDLSSMAEGTPNLLDGMNAAGAAIFCQKRWWRVGKTPSEPQLDALGERLRDRPELGAPARPVFVSDSLAREFPEAAAFAETASGILAVPLSLCRRHLLIWFRPETIQTVNWGGNPHDKPAVTGPRGPRLTPRKSFELFVESVRGRSLPWKPVEIEAALRLRLLAMEVVVARAERLAELNAELTRSNEDLDAFAYVASHDLKEPLRGIFKYAQQLLEDSAALNDEQRRRIEGLTRLTRRMDTLIDSLLHYSRVGRDPECHILWFRPEMVETVAWAGDPAKPVEHSPHGDFLTPRKSFERWRASVRGLSAAWKEFEIEGAGRLRQALLDQFRTHEEQVARLRDELARSHRELDAFLHIASHDLKEPVRGVYRHAEHLIQSHGAALDPAGQARLDALKRLSSRMGDLIDSLLHFSRAGRLDLSLADENLGQILAEAIEGLESRRRETGAVLRVPRPLPRGRCDGIWIREVFANLIANAMKYNDKPDPWVEVGFLDPAGDGAAPVFYVKDNGIGIPERHKEEIFKMFKRLHARDRFGGGSGAGLTICKKIIERHGGRLWVESTPGEGSTFFFQLEAEPAKQTAEREAPSPLQPNTQSQTA